MPSAEHKYWVIIPAAGYGKRMGGTTPKQYMQLGDKTVLEHTLDIFSSHGLFAGILVAVSEDDQYWDEIRTPGDTPISRVTGGSERRDSVLNALHYLEKTANPDDWVLVHDAARPCLRRAELDRLLEEVTHSDDGGLLGMPVRDTVKRTDNSQRVSETLDRQALWLAATPQMFRFGRLLQAMKTAIKQQHAITDEASAIELVGGSPVMVECATSNIKITTQQDLAIAEILLASSRGE